MRKTHRWITRVLTVLVTIAMTFAGASTMKVNAETEEVSRIEWLKQLTAAFQMSVEEDNYPDNYYADIDSSYEDYYTVMLATEFGLVDVEAGDNFCPDDAATREFAAHTLNLCMGFGNDKDSYSFAEAGTARYPDDIQVVINKGYLTLTDGNFYPDKAVTASEVQGMINAAKMMYTEETDAATDISTDEIQEVDILSENINDMISVEAAADVFEYKLDSKTGKYATITKYNGYSSTLIIPDTLDGYSVVEIGSGVFQNRTEIKSVTIPDSVTKIDSSAFSGCSNLQTLVLSKNLNEIEGKAFYNCDELTEIEIPKSLTSGGSTGGAFNNCDKLKKVTFEAGTTKIADYLFLNCTGLENITIPEGVTTIGSSSFAYCTNLKTVSMPESLTTVGSSAFRYCTALEQVVIPDDVTEIGTSAFSQCSNLKSVKLPKNIVKLGGKAFYNCDELTEIEIPKSLESGGYASGAFEDCDKLKKVTFEAGTTKVAEYLFRNCTGLETIVIPEGVTSIGHYAFFECKKLKTVSIPESARTIVDTAFGSCTALEQIVIPDGVTEIQDYVFSGCSNLKSVKLPKNLSKIGSQVFKNCGMITSIVIPDNVTSIGYGAFLNCSSLTNVALPSGLKEITSEMFKNCTALDKVIIPETVTNIGSNAFYNCDSLTAISIPNNVKVIESYAFSQCDSLGTVTLGEGLTEIRTYAFELCPALKSIVLPKKLTKIGNKAFVNCPKLTEVTIPKSVTSIGSNVFSYPGKLTIYGISGSYAESYANSIGAAFVSQDVPVTGLKLSSETLELKQNQTATLTVTVEPEDYTEEVVWESTNTSVVTVSNTGVVKAVNLGKATICVTAGNVTAKCNVNVTGSETPKPVATPTPAPAVTPTPAPAEPEIDMDADTSKYYNVTTNGGNWDGTHYYLPSGQMVRNSFFSDGSYTYYLQADGTAMKDRLTYHPDGVHVIYFDQNGHEVFSDFANITRSISGDAVNDMCFFNVYGYMYVDTLTYDKNGANLYYINPYGVLERNGWFQFSGHEFDAGLGFSGVAGGYGYANSDCSLMVNTYTYDWNGNFVYMQGDGHLQQ